MWVIEKASRRWVQININLYMFYIDFILILINAWCNEFGSTLLSRLDQKHHHGWYNRWRSLKFAVFFDNCATLTSTLQMFSLISFGKTISVVESVRIIGIQNTILRCMNTFYTEVFEIKPDSGRMILVLSKQQGAMNDNIGK